VAGHNTAATRIARQVDAAFPIEVAEDQAPQIDVSDEGRPVALTIETAAGAPWALDRIRSLKAADFLKIGGLRERIRTEGVGVPLVAELAASPKSDFTSSSGFYVPMTALIDFSSDDTATLTLHDPLQVKTVPFLGNERPLRADFSAPIATTYAMRPQQRIDVQAMFKFDKFADSLGLHRLGPIYPEKIPVVFVHGLKSNPDTWRDPLNELMDDPVIRERFEFWNFGYATGPAIPFSAMQLRESLESMAAYREKLGAPTDDVILVGHSMGGLLAGLMTQSSGDESWFKLFAKPLDELDIPESDRDLLRRMAYYEPLPFVNRVVFIATPHGGSDFAHNAISKVASDLIQLPGSLLTLSTDLLKLGVSVLTPIGIKVVRQMPTSIDTLQSDSELVRLFRSMPSNPEVNHHSIIGENDPYVPYESSHIDDAVSEKLVPAGHEAHVHPETIEELRRILTSHR